MTNKKNLYWITGVVVVLLILLALWIFMSNDGSAPGSPEESASAGQSASESSDAAGSSASSADGHDGMDMGASHPSDNSGEEDEALTAYLDEQDQIMTKMIDDMEGIEETGYAASDFLAGMIPHHEAAIAMAESYLNHGGSHEDLKRLSNDIIKVQKEEVSQMETMLKQLNEGEKKDEAAEAAYLTEYQKMFEAHHTMHGAAAKDLDSAFADGMIMHHQMAIDMSKAILNHTDEEGVRKLAEQIIAAQEKEIEEMQKILKK